MCIPCATRERLQGAFGPVLKSPNMTFSPATTAKAYCSSRREGVLAGADPRVAGGTLCAVNVANRTMETYSFDCGEELRAGDILRVLRTDQCEGRTIE